MEMLFKLNVNYEVVTRWCSSASTQSAALPCISVGQEKWKDKGQC